MSQRGTPWPAQVRDKALKLSDEIGVSAAAKKLQIPLVTLQAWRKHRKQMSTHQQLKNLRTYPDEFVHDAVAHANLVGIRRASEEMNVPYQTLVRWRRLPAPRISKVKSYPDSIRARALELANTESRKRIAEILNVPVGTITGWIYKSNPARKKRVLPVKVYSEDFKKSAVQLASDYGVIHAANVLNIPEGTLRFWHTKRTGHKPSPRAPARAYDRDFIDEVLQRVTQVGFRTASDELNAPIRQVRRWAKALGVKSPRKPGVSASWDISLEWMNREHPELAQWRDLATDWLKLQRTGVHLKIAAIRAFVLKYLIPNKAPADPSWFVSISSNLATLETFLPVTRHGGVMANYLHAFIQWVLNSRFSYRRPDGSLSIHDEFHNPFPKRSFAGMPSPQNSVFNPLPYAFLAECQSIIASGPNFRDWTWAHTALGVKPGKQGKVAPDWFEVSEEQIDKSDPDCVWRRRARSRAAGGVILEIWSPVRWVAQLVKLILPVRTFQVRMLDSGEADTWRYEIHASGNGRWIRNSNNLRLGTPRNPLSQGVFRQLANSLESTNSGEALSYINAVLYINTNKTADALKSGPEKGYTLPWVADARLHANPFYWLMKLRDWQEKYNPLDRRVSWTELDGRHMHPKSAEQLARYPNTCFLFRAPELGADESRLPLPDGVLDHTWYAVLQTLEQRLNQRGQTNRDGSKIELVVPGRSKTVHFPPHSIRVSLITALVVDGEVPIEIMQKLVGHARMLMTLYYTKPGDIKTLDSLSGAFEQLIKNAEQGVTKFLLNADHEKLVQDAISNSGPSLLSAIPRSPVSRNAVGWSYMHHGVCLAGGNVSPLEGPSGIGGCYNGGPDIGSAGKPKFSPVPGGSRNCVRCRWFVTEPLYIFALVAHCNVLLYHFGEARSACVEADSHLQGLRIRQMQSEEAGSGITSTNELESAERVWETAMQRFQERAEDVAACIKLVFRCQEALEKRTGKEANDRSLLAVGSLSDIRVALDGIDSELLQLQEVCETLEVFPELETGKAVFRRSQLLDLAIQRESVLPPFLALSEKHQLAAGNEFMRRAANLAEGPTVAARKQRIVRLIEANSSLRDVLGIDVSSLLKDSGAVAKPVTFKFNTRPSVSYEKQ